MNVDSQFEKKFSLGRDYISGNERSKSAAPFIFRRSAIVAFWLSERAEPEIFRRSFRHRNISTDKNQMLDLSLPLLSPRQERRARRVALVVYPPFFFFYYFIFKSISSMFCSSGESVPVLSGMIVRRCIRARVVTSS